MERNSLAGVTVGVTAAAVAAMAAVAGCAGAAWAASGPPAPRVEVHAESTPPGAEGGDASVCVFYLNAVGFPAGGQVRWSLTRAETRTGAGGGPRAGGAPGAGGGPGAGGAQLRADTIPLGAAGSGVTENMRLTDGHYALRWASGGTAGQQDFAVSCTDGSAGTAAGGPPADAADAARPEGGAPAGGVNAARPAGGPPAGGVNAARPAGGPPADGAAAARPAVVPVAGADGAAGSATAAPGRRGVLAEASGLSGGLKGMAWAAAALLLAGGLLIFPRPRP